MNSALIAVVCLTSATPAVLPNLAATVGGSWLRPEGGGGTLVAGGELDLLIVLIDPQEPIVFGTPPKRNGVLLVPFVEAVHVSDLDAWRLTAGAGVALVIPWKTMLCPIVLELGVGYVRQWRARDPDGIAVRVNVVPTPFALLGAYVRGDHRFGAGQSVEAGLTLNLLPVAALVAEGLGSSAKTEKAAPAKQEKDATSGDDRHVLAETRRSGRCRENSGLLQTGHAFATECA